MGKATHIPSGKFCTAIPSPKRSAENAAASERGASANATPTAIPSGILCSVTAKYKSAARLSPMAENALWRRERSASLTTMNAPPSRKPTVTVRYGGSALSASIAGRSREKKLAAIMIPAESPRRTVKTPSFGRRENNTKDAPSAVMKYMMSEASSACCHASKDKNHAILPLPALRGQSRHHMQRRAGKVKAGENYPICTKIGDDFFLKKFYGES